MWTRPSNSVEQLTIESTVHMDNNAKSETAPHKLPLAFRFVPRQPDFDRISRLYFPEIRRHHCQTQLPGQARLFQAPYTGKNHCRGRGGKVTVEQVERKLEVRRSVFFAPIEE